MALSTASKALDIGLGVIKTPQPQQKLGFLPFLSTLNGTVFIITEQLKRNSRKPTIGCGRVQHIGGLSCPVPGR